ncbi:MAG: response regulator transcription factor [Phycisphaerales bacterium]|jgi:FixJ family two-component response regulator
MSEFEPTVFIIDDDEAVRDGLGQLMQSINLNVKTFSSAAEFLGFCKPDMQGCLVLDVRMPGMSGLKLQEELLLRNISLPIIFISGHGDVPMAVETIRKGAIDFMEKPVGDQALLDRVQEALEKDAQFKKEQAKRDAAKAKFELLTPREREVLDLIMAGKLNKVIASELGLSHRTVEVHRASIMEKMGVDSVAELVILINNTESSHV